MDDSWRMRMGMPSVPGRRSGADRTLTRSVFASAVDSQSTSLHADDFKDVFGGPPRSVLPRQLSGCSTSFYEEIFRPEYLSVSEKSGRNLPEFRIPARKSEEGFYSDIFGSDDEFQRRSRERSKARSNSNSSSVMSSEELSPLRPVTGDDVGLSSFTSKLRPINVRWDSSTMKPTKDHSKKQGNAAGVHCSHPSHTENQYKENVREQHARASYFGFTRKVVSPETISIEPSSFQSVKLSADDLELNSPSSEVSTLCQEHVVKLEVQDREVPEKKAGMVEQEELDDEGDDDDEEEEDDDDDEVMSSYVIEINSDHREGTCEEDNLEEAIAWAKEKFQTHSASEKESSMTPHHHSDQSIEMEEGKPNANEYPDQPRDEHDTTRTAEMELEFLDEDIRLWSAGKESNIRMLLSTLHQILWPNSGWYTIPLTSLIESSQVKKAYQKARLCLHPDKLQQRSATPAQKYVAQKAFSILQDAWALFISQDVFII